MPADEMADQLGITLPPGRDYQTLAGFVLAHMGRLPAVGEHVEVSAGDLRSLIWTAAALTRCWQAEFR
jgi:CBS domain containing-hemolysin-like protein